MNSMQIPAQEIKYHPLSWVDQSGRLFWWRGELYRSISDGRAPLYRKLFEDGLVRNLVQSGLLVDTTISDHTVTDGALLLKHRTIPFVSYPYEWCSLMLKDAAILVLDLELELNRKGLTLHDAHPWNVLFDGTRPRYVDFGSIVPLQETAIWPAHDLFCRFLLRPLQLQSCGHTRIARLLLHDLDQGVLASDVTALTGQLKGTMGVVRALKGLFAKAGKFVPLSIRSTIKRCYEQIPSRPTSVNLAERRAEGVMRLRQQVDEISIRLPRTEWSQYYDNSFPPFSPCAEWTRKHHGFYKIISDLRPRTIFDIGCNRGWYSQMAARLGVNVVAADVDDTCVGQLYVDAKREGVNILPLVMDIRTPEQGNQWLASAADRLKCDMVVALALVHHLVFKKHLTFDHIIGAVSAFASKYLLIEFVPREDRYVREWWTEQYYWYSENKFRVALSQHYSKISVLQSFPEPRLLFLCEK